MAPERSEHSERSPTASEASNAGSASLRSACPRSRPLRREPPAENPVYFVRTGFRSQAGSPSRGLLQERREQAARQADVDDEDLARVVEGAGGGEALLGGDEGG